MNIVTTTSVFPPKEDATRILRRLSQVGFDCLDMAFDYCTAAEHPFAGDGWREWATALRAQADLLQVRYTHAHACGSANARNELMKRCFEACSILGIRYLVVHPVHQLNGAVITDDAEFVRINAEASSYWLPFAEANDVIILSENLLWGSSIHPTVIAELVKTVDHPNFGWCFDTGHVHCSGLQVSALQEASVIPMSLHIQDNHGLLGRDEHLLPGDGTIHWKSFLDLLYQIGYRGDVVLEAHHQSLDAPDEEREAILSDLLCRAQKMKRYLESIAK